MSPTLDNASVSSKCTAGCCTTFDLVLCLLLPIHLPTWTPLAGGHWVGDPCSCIVEQLRISRSVQCAVCSVCTVCSVQQCICSVAVEGWGQWVSNPPLPDKRHKSGLPMSSSLTRMMIRDQSQPANLKELFYRLVWQVVESDRNLMRLVNLSAVAFSSVVFIHNWNFHLSTTTHEMQMCN